MSSQTISPPNFSWVIVRRACAGSLLLFVLAGLSAPWIDGSRWADMIARHLEEALGRKIAFEKVHFTLFTGPGFSLENVTISEDPRFGREPFAFVPVLQVRVRPDRLFFGEIRLSTLRLVEPALNLVKRSDDTWNVVELLRRLGAPRRSPFHLFPIFEMEDARVYIKFGARKTALYLLDTALAVYPERSGKLTMRFSGSPARTDRAGNGFGHLRGDLYWRLNAAAQSNALEADIELDPSNLSELTTLIQGYDLGVHGTVTSQLHVSGPLAALQVQGNMRFNDVHRWDLIPSNGGDLHFRFGGIADLVQNRLNIKTWGREASPLSVALSVRQFLTRPDWTLTANMKSVPLSDILPMGRRLGLSLPSNLTVVGAADGELTLSSGAGLSGNGTLRDITATLPNIPPLSATAVNVTVQQDRVHFQPARLQTGDAHLQMGGDYFLMTPKAAASIETVDFPVADFKASIAPWLGMPANLDLISDGKISGRLLYSKEEESDGIWGGKLQFSGTTLRLEGLAKPLRNAEGRISFNGDELEVARLTCLAGDRVLHGSYRRGTSPRHGERLRLEMPAVDFEEIQQMLGPTIEAQGWLARLHVAKRNVPSWLAARDMEGELSVNHFFVNGTETGSLNSRFLWRGTTLEFPSIALSLPQGVVQAHGSAALASYQPHYSFQARVDGFPWAGGLLSAEGSFETSGTGADVLRNLQSNGTFSGDDISVTPENNFSRVAGGFLFSFTSGWPNLRLIKVQAENIDGTWTGEGVSQSDGKLVLDLEHAGQQRHIVSSLSSESTVASLPTHESW